MLGSSFRQTPAQIPAQFPCSLKLPFAAMPAGTWQRAPFLFWSLVLFVCAQALPRPGPLAVGCQGKESFLSSAHTPPLAHEGTEPEHSEVGTELGAWGRLSAFQRPAPHLASPLCHPLNNSHCTEINEHAAAAWEPPQHAPKSSREQSWGLAACCLPPCLGDGSATNSTILQESTPSQAVLQRSSTPHPFPKALAAHPDQARKQVPGWR